MIEARPTTDAQARRGLGDASAGPAKYNYLSVACSGAILTTCSVNIEGMCLTRARRGLAASPTLVVPPASSDNKECTSWGGACDGLSP